MCFLLLSRETGCGGKLDSQKDVKPKFAQGDVGACLQLRGIKKLLETVGARPGNRTAAGFDFFDANICYGGYWPSSLTYARREKLGAVFLEEEVIVSIKNIYQSFRTQENKASPVRIECVLAPATAAVQHYPRIRMDPLD
jgi:hypothetical protein